jgi:hypothetical protein
MQPELNLSLPFSGRTQMSRHRSAQAAKSAADGRVTKSLRWARFPVNTGAESWPERLLVLPEA